MTEETAYSGWALVEQMGFRQTVAIVREVEQYGTKMVRLDVPYFDKPDGPPSGFTTRFAGGSSLYQVSPLAEDLALASARQQRDSQADDRQNADSGRFVGPTISAHMRIDENG